jgi:radical SAM protein with 4Fe4S-binding SPASM domain
LKHLYQATKLIDISNFFILICTKYDASDLVTNCARLYSTDAHPFQTLTITDLPTTDPLSTDYVLPDTVCPLPWMHLEITHKGFIRPCCVFQGNIGNINDQLLTQIFDSHTINSLRDDFLKGKKPQGCQTCWDNESQGLTSNRKYHVSLLKKDLLVNFLSDPSITSLDLKPGNTCNFKCRICGPDSSSLHVAEQNQFLKIHSLPSDNWIDQSRHIDQLIDLLPTLKNIDMYGGEPFLIKKFDLILKTAVEQGHANHIRLHYNTNGSIYPQNTIEHWKHFQHVDIQISIDNIGSRFEIERGGSWNLVEDNVKKLLALDLPNLQISVMPAINIMNIFYIGELLDWAKSLKLTVNPLYVHDPTEFSIKNLTREAKNILIKKYQTHNWPEMKNILESINAWPDSDGADFVNKTDYFDRLRNENFAESHPEIAVAMGYGHQAVAKKY